MGLGGPRAFQLGFCGGAFGHPSSGARTMSELCIDCNRDTSFRSGLFVNRIPADNGKKDGYLCPDCQSMDCDYCHESALNWGSDNKGGIICDDCAEQNIALHGG
jgi:hypothetical protein